MNKLTLIDKSESPATQALRLGVVLAAAFLLFVIPESAMAQATVVNMSALDNLLCGIYSYLATKILFYVALIVAIVGILTYLLKMNKEIWGTLFVIALLIGVAKGIVTLLSTLGGFGSGCIAAG